MKCGFCGQAVDPNDRMHFCQQMINAMPKTSPRIGMRILTLGPDIQAKADAVMEYARTHIHLPGVGPVPGDVPEHVLHIPVGIRTVFSHTRLLVGDVPLYRYLSISVDRPGHIPSPEVAFPIAFNLFRFKFEQTSIAPDEDECTVICIEPVEP